MRNARPAWMVIYTTLKAQFPEYDDKRMADVAEAIYRKLMSAEAIKRRAKWPEEQEPL